MGRTKYSQREVDAIRKILHRKQKAKRGQQSQLRHVLRVDYEFNISDFNVPGQPFGVEEFDAAIRRGAIKILDEATIEAMKEKRARDKAKDALLNPKPEPQVEQTDWKQAMKEWNDYYDSHSE